jgi:hypothetical protein
MSLFQEKSLALYEENSKGTIVKSPDKVLSAREFVQLAAVPMVLELHRWNERLLVMQIP